MYRILSAGLDTLAATIVLVPLLLVLGKLWFHSGKKTIYYSVFALYLTAVCAVTGLPSILDCRLDITLNFVPFLGMGADFKNCLLNVLLFVPLGVLVPLLCPEFRAPGKSILFGFCVSCLIEFLQLFTFRSTDINDIITNTVGTAVGSLLALIALKKWPKLSVFGKNKRLF